MAIAFRLLPPIACLHFFTGKGGGLPLRARSALNALGRVAVMVGLSPPFFPKNARMS